MLAITIEDVLACPNLPTLPAVALKVLELTRNKDVAITEIASVVQSDPALTAKILKTVNSPFYGLSQPIPTSDRALSFLGLSAVKSLVLGFSLARVVGDEEDGFSLSDYWQRCILSAAGARRITTRAGGCPEEAFAAALMQDLGMLALHATAGEAYDELVHRTQGDHRRLDRTEREELGFDHAQVGAMLGERWHLPEELVVAIRHHHDAVVEEHGQLVRSVALAAEIATAMSLSNPGAAIQAVKQRAEEWFGFEDDVVVELLAGVNEDAQELTSHFDVDTGAPLDINMILAEAQESVVRHQLALEREAADLRKSNDELSRIAVTDNLTQLGNRKRFDDELANRFEQASAFRGTLGLILADVDHFKSVNDTHGHPVGDAVLMELAARLKPAVRGVDVVCRYGGEEFAVLLPGADVKDVAAIAERLRVIVATEPFEMDPSLGMEAPLAVTISLGAAVYDSSTVDVLSSPPLLIKAADRALYVAKDSGRNCVRVFRIDHHSSSSAA